MRVLTLRAQESDVFSIETNLTKQAFMKALAKGLVEVFETLDPYEWKENGMYYFKSDKFGMAEDCGFKSKIKTYIDGDYFCLTPYQYLELILFCSKKANPNFVYKVLDNIVGI